MDIACCTSPTAIQRRLWLVAALTALGTAALLLGTSFGLPMVWDEGDAILRSDGIQRWCKRWWPERQEAIQPGPLRQAAIADDWSYATRREGHPAFYGIVIAAGRAVSASWLPPLQSARFGPILLFAAATGAMFYRLAKDYSTVTATGGVAALLLLPRLFAHAHFASFDGPLVSCWILAWATFAPAMCSWRWAIAWGFALGMTFSCKATGWLAPLPFLIWAGGYRDRRAGLALLIGLPAALLTFYFLNPPLWHHPIQGLDRFFALNLNRGAQGLNISTQFLGQIYNLDRPLPWYNTLLWTGITVPFGILFLFGIGLWHVLQRLWDKPGMLLVANWLILLVVRAIPGTPPHDGVRLFLPSFAFLAALAGVGTARGLTACHGRRYAAVVGLVVVFGGSATSLAWYAPQWLSYYNVLIGGLPGAVAMGMEPTYYWDGLDRDVLDWLHQHTEPGEKVEFACFPKGNLALMTQWGQLHSEYRLEAPGRFRWYVLQHRPSAWQPADRWLSEHATPAYRKLLRRSGLGPWQLSIPLVDVYSYDQFCRAYTATEAP
jgi:4-amino-4-deoxy-L-arabinose transferase-like glycosyltransferase